MAARIRIGIVGLGAAGRAFLPAIRGHAAFELVAVVEPVAETRESIARETGAKAFADLPSMLAGASLDAVYIATPTELHPEHCALAFAAKKHVLTEKPMAITLDQGRAMIEAAERAGVVLLVGHSHSYDLPIKRMREIVAGGSLGRVRMIHTWNFTDWIYRPRRPDELEVSLGGGVTFRQGSHQFDIIRLLGGGLVKSVQRDDVRLGRGAALDRRAHGVHAIRRRRSGDRGVQRLWLFLDHGADRGRDGVGLHRAIRKARAGTTLRRQRGGRTRGQTQTRRQRDPGKRAAPATFRPDVGELRARRHPAVAGRAVRLFETRAARRSSWRTTAARAIWCSMNSPMQFPARPAQSTTAAGASPISKSVSPRSSHRKAARRSI